MLTVVLAALVVALVAYRAAYGNWPGQGPPLNLECGDRIYRRDADDRARTLDQLELSPVHDLRRTPPVVGWRVAAELSPRERRRERLCGLAICVHIGGGEYMAYGLQGGR